MQPLLNDTPGKGEQLPYKGQAVMAKVNAGML